MARKIKVTATMLQHSRQNLNYGQKQLAELFNTEETKVKVHADGTVERLNKVTNAQIKYFLTGKRVFDGIECMEELNRGIIDQLLSSGMVRKTAAQSAKNAIYWITKKAAEHYGLKPITSSGMPFKFVD